MLEERLAPLRERGAVVATIWTSFTGYANTLGWAAPAPVFSWAVPTDQLRRSFDPASVDIDHGAGPQADRLQRESAAQWNGPWQRPSWWDGWQRDQHPTLESYRFALPGEQPTGLLSLQVEQHPTEGRQVVVHDFSTAARPRRGRCSLSWAAITAGSPP